MLSRPFRRSSRRPSNTIGKIKKKIEKEWVRKICGEPMGVRDQTAADDAVIGRFATRISWVAKKKMVVVVRRIGGHRSKDGSWEWERADDPASRVWRGLKTGPDR